MISSSRAFSGFSVDDIDAARVFYRDVIGVDVSDEMGNLSIDLGNGARVFVYEKPHHEPATYTVLNFEVEDIDVAVGALERSGVSMLRYEGFPQDEHGIARPPAGSDSGPDIAWFADPAGNVLSVISAPAR